MARIFRASASISSRDHRTSVTVALFARVILSLWCILGTVLSGPVPEVTQKLEGRFTTSRPAKIIVEMATAKSRLPLTWIPLEELERFHIRQKIEGLLVFQIEQFQVQRMTDELQIMVESGQLMEVVNSELKTTTTTATSPASSSEQPLYRVNSSNGQACILLQVDALITVKYKTIVGEEREADIYVPNDATVTGNCANDNSATMSLKWKAFVLFWSFARSPGGEGWYVDKIELTYNSSDRHFELIDQPNKTIRLSTGKKHATMFFPTPVGKSYACNEKEVTLTDGKNQASVLLREMKLQPFKFKSNNFATEFWCRPERAARDETAPVAVGSTLAAAVLLTITGYAAYRYFKVKKVQYDTME